MDAFGYPCYTELEKYIEHGICLQDGFLRGVAVAGDSVFVGLTARRGSSPDFHSARIVELDRQSLEHQGEWIVPNEFGRQVFSIVDVSDIYA